jgi:replication factor C subunit 2/4
MNNLPFSEKYRPRKLEDLILDPIIYTKIKTIIATKDIPNIIFTGKSGVGKTSTIHCIARAIYPREYHESIVELNASDDRGIKSVHETIINFCKKKVYFTEGCAQHKLLILDEADNITKKAQRLINSIMEKYPTTRFAFTCNNSLDIIESIQSRCIIIRFTKPPLENFINRIKLICNNEKINYDNDAIPYLFEICQKDLRQTLNLLELTYKTFSDITIKNINNCCDIPSQQLLDDLLNSIINNDVKIICILINNFEKNGYYSLDVMLHFIQFIKNKKDLNEDKKINLINILSNFSYIMSKSSTTYLQLTAALLSCTT